MAESKFAASLVRMFNSNGCNATRIESHGTGNGIPDMYVLGFGTDFWLELKHDPKLGQNARTIKVDWRPGQQGWMYIYCLQHSDGGPHKRRNMWFNSMIREEPYPGSNGR